MKHDPRIIVVIILMAIAVVLWYWSLFEIVIVILMVIILAMVIILRIGIIEVLAWHHRRSGVTKVLVVAKDLPRSMLLARLRWPSCTTRHHSAVVSLRAACHGFRGCRARQLSAV